MKGLGFESLYEQSGLCDCFSAAVTSMGQDPHAKVTRVRSSPPSYNDADSHDNRWPERELDSLLGLGTDVGRLQL